MKLVYEIFQDKENAKKHFDAMVEEYPQDKHNKTELSIEFGGFATIMFLTVHEMWKIQGAMPDKIVIHDNCVDEEMYYSVIGPLLDHAEIERV